MNRAIRAWRAAPIGWLLAGALLLHIVLMPARGWERDLYWFITWMRVAVERGVAHVSEAVWCDYPPGYLYMLTGIGLLWTTLLGQPIPADGTLAARFLVKLLPVLADLATAWVLYRIALRRFAAQRSLAYAALILAAYACNPAMVFNSAVWGQADSVLALLLLLTAWALCEEWFATAFGVFTAAVLVKLQAIVFLPVFLLVALRRGGVPGVLAAARGAALTALALLLPFFAAQRMEPLITTIFGASGRYPYISMNAHNVWWLVGKGRSIELSDALRVGNGLFTYHAVGTLMLGGATLLILWRLWRDLYASQRDTFPALVEAGALQVLAFYLFPTQMHERYVVPLLVFLAAACIWQPRMWWAYGACSLAVLLSLASTLHANFPEGMGGYGSVLPASRSDTIALSWFFMLSFGTLLLWTADRHFRRLAPPVMGLAAGIVAGVALMPLYGSVSLSDWEPTAQYQQWGSMQHNRSVDGHRLSAYGFIFRTGIGTHAVSKLTYHLNGAFRSFDTEFAVDDEASRGQRIRFRILIDGSPHFDSGDITAGGFPRHISVPVDGAEFLTLEVLDGGDGITADHADWLAPVLLR